MISQLETSCASDIRAAAGEPDTKREMKHRGEWKEADVMMGHFMARRIRDLTARAILPPQEPRPLFCFLSPREFVASGATFCVKDYELHFLHSAPWHMISLHLTRESSQNIV